MARKHTSPDDDDAGDVLCDAELLKKEAVDRGSEQPLEHTPVGWFSWASWSFVVIPVNPSLSQLTPM
jgi:hypothetical protein